MVVSMVILTADASTSAAQLTLIGALGGVLITGGIALATAILNHRWQAKNDAKTTIRDHNKELRQARRSVYQEYWSYFAALNQKQNALGRAYQADEPPDSSSGEGTLTVAKAEAEEQSAYDDWWERRIAVILIGDQNVRSALDEHLIALRTLREELYQNAGNISEVNTNRIDEAANALFRAMRSEIIDLDQHL
jgi:hypothetical protein